MDCRSASPAEEDPWRVDWGDVLDEALVETCEPARNEQTVK